MDFFFCLEYDYITLEYDYITRRVYERGLHEENDYGKSD